MWIPLAEMVMLGGFCLVSTRMVWKPPVRARMAPLPMRSPSLLVGSGSTMARMTMAAPNTVMPLEMATAVHSLP